MPGLFSDVDQQNQLAAATRAPVAGPETTPAESFRASLDVNQQAEQSTASASNAYDFVQQRLDDYEAKTGEALHNPIVPGGVINADRLRARFTQEARDKFADYAKRTGDTSLAFPTDEEIAQGSVGIARKALARQEQIGGQAQAPFAGVAGFLGSVVGQATDPVNALAVATIPEGGLGARMLGAAGAFGGGQLLTDLSSYGFKKQVYPDFGPGQVVKDVAEQAAGGAAFELGGKLIGDAAGALWRRFKTTAPAIADKVPEAMQDAGNAAERVGDWNAQNPFTGADGDAAHKAAIAKIEADIIAGRKPELPPEAEAAAAARGPAPDEIDAHARDTNPTLFALTDKVEGQIAEARAKLGEALADPNFRMLEKNIPVENDLRANLNELQMQRAAMGPEVNAARQEAEQFLVGHPEAPPAREPIAEPPSPATAKEAFGDPTTIDAAAAHPFKNINRMADALEGAANEWRAMRAAAARGDIPPSQDITPHVMMAVRALVRARDEGKTIADVMNNGPEFHSDTGQLAAGLFFDKESGKFLSKAQMTENLKSLADGLREGPKVEAGAEPSRPLPPSARATPEEIAKAPDDPNVHAAMVADLQRNIEQGRNRVPSYDADGNVQAGVADSELAAIERQEAAANEIANCTTPVVEGAAE